MFFAIIGDMVASKQLPNRTEAQERLRTALEDVNWQYQDDIASDFMITLGDEFQGLLRTGEHFLELIDRIQCQIYPLRMRFGIGIGAMSTPIFRESSIGSDGPAYWAARKAISYIHDKNDYGNAKIRVEKQEVEGDEQEQLLKLVNASLKLCDRYENAWTESQQKFVRDVLLQYQYGQQGEYNQREIARKLGISPQLTNNKMKHTGLATYVEMRRSIQNMLQREWGDEE